MRLVPERLPSLIVLGALAVLAVAASPAGAYEEHDPIRIEGNEDLTAPDAVAGNGVRGGTGTENDPYRIERWTIEADRGRTALAISDVTAHVLVRQLEIRLGPGEKNLGLAIAETRNLAVEDIEVTGGGRVAEFGGAALAWQDSRVAMTGALSRVEATDTRLTVENVTVDGPCGLDGFFVDNSTFVARSITMQDVFQGLRFRGQATEASVEASVLEDVDPGEASQELADSARAQLGLRVGHPYPQRVKVDGSRIEGFDGGCATVDASAASTDRAPVVRLVDTEVVGCGTAYGLRLPFQGTVDVDTENVAFAENRWGLVANGGEHELTGATFRDNEVGIRARGDDPGLTRIRLQFANFANNGLAAKATEGAEIVVERGEWDDPHTEGNAQIGPAGDVGSSTAVPGPTGLGTGLAIALGALAAAERSRQEASR